MSGHIVAGYDGSVIATAACRWAADEAVRLAAELRIVGCLPAPPADAWRARDTAFVSTRPARQRDEWMDHIRELAVELSRAYPTTPITTRTVAGHPRRVLLDEAASADLLVIGNTAGGGRHAMYAGSVAHTVVRESSCPVVVVPSQRAAATRPLVVLGIDGTARSEAALDWAIDEAAMRSTELEIVHALSHSSCVGALEQAVARARDRLGSGVEGRLVDGSAAAELATLSNGAELVVVGSRSRHGVAFTVPGSVVDALISHAACPVAVVRDTSDDGLRTAGADHRVRELGTFGPEPSRPIERTM